MTKIVAVVGATGKQGGAVVQALLKQGEYKVRGLTRNVSSDKAKALIAQGVEAVSADLNDEASLTKAFQGATAIFAVTDFSEPFRHVPGGPDHARDTEYRQGVNMARAALQTPTLEHLIWSTLPNSDKLSDGKFVIPHFMGKCGVDDFIRSQPELLAKTTFLWLPYFSSNFFYAPFQPYFLKSIGTYVQIQPVPPSTPYALAGDITVNTGVMVKAILSNPSKTLGGKYAFGKVETMSSGDYLQLWAKATGKRAHYLQVSMEEFERLFADGWGRELGLMLQLAELRGEQAWSGQGELVTAADLGVQGELVTPENALMATDWTSLL